MPGLLLDTLARQARRPSVPIWLMRQAGRYLPEYRALRAEKGGFLELVYDSEAAAEVTLQPIRRFGFDGAILFSDILIVPYALGQDLAFEAGEGPRLSPPLVDAALDAPARRCLSGSSRSTRPCAGSRAGSARRRRCWALPAARGRSRPTWSRARAAATSTSARRWPIAIPARSQAIIDAIVAVTVDYLVGQIEAGAEAVQLFDSWAGSLAPAEFERWVIAPTARDRRRAQARAIPDVPVIGFPKGAGAKLPAYARETGVDAVGLDETVDPLWAAREAARRACRCRAISIRCCCSPAATSSKARRARILDAFADRPHVFNLGHGIGQDTPIAHVEQLLARGARLAAVSGLGPVRCRKSSR